MSEESYAKIERLGKYRILAEIGRGGMARVFRAEDTETDAIVAVKALLPELASQLSFIKRFRREVETLKALEHPNIVKVLDVGEDCGYQFYVMEYMDGSTIDKKFRLSGKSTVPEALAVTRAVADALQYAHAKGVIHRDIKLANIMTDSSGTVKLADFGIAKDVEATRLTVTGGIVGTADYMSPEQAEGRRVTRKSDIYSLGVCLYQMLTGRLPFVGKTYMDVIRAHRFSLPETPRTLNPLLPARVSKLIEMMMEKDPDKRLSSAGDVIALIDAIGAPEGRMSDEDRDSARELVEWALLPAYDWQRVAVKIAAVVVVAGLGVLAAFGIHYRYFTSAQHKYSLGLDEFRQEHFGKANRYFEEVAWFHPESSEAVQAKEMSRLIVIAMKNSQAQGRKKTPPSAMQLYEQARLDVEAGRTEEGKRLLRILATTLGQTDGGRLAALKLAEPSSSDSTLTVTSTDTEFTPAGVSSETTSPSE